MIHMIWAIVHGRWIFLIKLVPVASPGRANRRSGYPALDRFAVNKVRSTGFELKIIQPLGYEVKKECIITIGCGSQLASVNQIANKHFRKITARYN